MSLARGLQVEEHGVTSEIVLLGAQKSLTEVITSTFERPILMPHEYVQRYERYMRGLHRTPRTIRQRTRWAKRVLERWPDPGKAATTDIIEWLGELEFQSDRERFSSSTTATYFGDTKAFFRWMTLAGLVPANPMGADDLERPKAKRGIPKPLSNDERERALQHAHEHQNMEAFLRLALHAGLRASEVAAFRGESISEHVVTMIGKGDKEASIPTAPELWNVARRYPRRGWWFPSPAHDGHISGSSVTIMVGRYFRRPEVDIPKGSIHRARHSFGSAALDKGGDLREVQELMRHSSSATTDIYTRVHPSKLRGLVGRLYDPESA